MVLFDNADVLPEAEPCRQNLLIRQRRFILQVNDPGGTISLPRRNGHAFRSIQFALARRDRVTVRVTGGMPERRIQFVELGFGQ